jgi:hypothetical protein
MPDHLDLVLVNGYVTKLLGNARVVKFLGQHYAEILAEFPKDRGRVSVSRTTPGLLARERTPKSGWRYVSAASLARTSLVRGASRCCLLDRPRR